MTRPNYCRAVLVLLFAVSVIACTGQKQETPFTDRDIREVRNRTVPKDGRLIAASQLVRDDFGLRATWEIEIASDDQTYFDWLATQLTPEHHVTANTASTITFVKETRGDSFSLEFSSNTTSSRSVASATFIALAD
jgi:hypothetical protein